MDLTEAEDIKKRWQEYTEELYKIDLHRIIQLQFLQHYQPGQGTSHAKMGSIKDRNGMDLTEAEDIKKRWQEYIEEQKRSS